MKRRSFDGYYDDEPDEKDDGFYEARAVKRLRERLRCKCHSASEEPCEACSMSEEDAEGIEKQIEENRG